MADLLQSQKALEAELEEARTALLAESEKARETRKALMDETTALAGPSLQIPGPHLAHEPLREPPVQISRGRVVAT